MCKRYINWLPLTCPHLGAWPVTQACVLTGNWTCNLLVCSPVLNPLNHTSQGSDSIFNIPCDLPFIAWVINTWWLHFKDLYFSYGCVGRVHKVSYLTTIGILESHDWPCRYMTLSWGPGRNAEEKLFCQFVTHWGQNQIPNSERNEQGSQGARQAAQSALRGPGLVLARTRVWYCLTSVS